MTPTPSIAIIDYGAGNLHSVAKAFDKIGYPGSVTADPAAIAAADAVVLPGVGAARDTVDGLAARGLTQTVHDAIDAGKPFFGVCIGLQVLFDRSEEEDAECLGILPGTVRRLPPGPKVPHMGWNQVRATGPHPLLDGIPDGSNFYFVHSYYAEPADYKPTMQDTCDFVRTGRTRVVATTEYDADCSFASVLGRGPARRDPVPPGEERRERSAHLPQLRRADGAFPCAERRCVVAPPAAARRPRRRPWRSR